MSESNGSANALTDRSPAPEGTSDTIATSDVFVSYASQDVAIANAVVAALERRGLKCWIAPRDVTPGALYADEIIRAINGTKVLVLVLSKSATASPHIGKEVERASSKRRRIVTLRTDASQLTTALEYFLSESQWIDLGNEGTEAAFAKLVSAVRHQLAPVPPVPPVSAPDRAQLDHPPSAVRRYWPFGATFAAVGLVLAWFAIDKFRSSRHFEAPIYTSATQPDTPAAPLASPAAFTPPPHSIAVLPFVNMSGDPKQEYFSDGISEELLNALSRLNDLQVVARTSSFSFKGKDVDISTIAHKMNVGAVLEGSVRRAGNTVRITVQLINTVNGFHIWSQTYDRRLSDILKVQADVASSVAQELHSKLVGDEVAAIELGGTKNQEAYDAYLRAMQAYDKANTEAEYRSVLTAADEAIKLDSGYAAAHVLRANSLLNLFFQTNDPSARPPLIDQMLVAARRAVKLAPQFGEAHLTLAETRAVAMYDFVGAAPEYELALALSPGSALVQRNIAAYSMMVGHYPQAVAAARRAVVLDPQGARTRVTQGIVLYAARRFSEALSVLQDARALNPDSGKVASFMALTLLAMGLPEQTRLECESDLKRHIVDEWHYCFALAYHTLGRQTDAEREFQQFKSSNGDESAYQYAELYAQFSDNPTALQWLAKAYRLRDPELQFIKGDWQLDPIRNEPQFKAIEAMMNFPP